MKRTQLEFELNAMNGRSWPHTERIALTVGDTARRRVINAGNDVHMMHLHGFHFQIQRSGPVGRDTVFSGAKSVAAVTEPLPQDAAFSLEVGADSSWQLDLPLSFRQPHGAALAPCRGPSDIRRA